MSRLSRPFYGRPSPEVARDLLGKLLKRRTSEGVVGGRLVETEAYIGERDPGSHAFRGETSRNRVMFGPPGHLYVYFTYGMHFCMNVVTDAEGVAGAVLLRAAEPLCGIDIITSRRGNRPLRDLCSGPAKLCQAFAIDRRQNGLDLEGDEMWLEDDGYIPERIEVSTRVGLATGRELPLRFFLPGTSYVSAGRPSNTEG